KKNDAPPGDEIEIRLAEIWDEVLGLDRQGAVGIRDNFFELGGHSLKATILVSRIHQALNVKVPLAEIFITPTIEGLAKTIKAAAADKYASIKPVEEKDYYELSPAQKRLYVLQQMEPTVTSYNLPAVFELKGNPDIPTVEEAVRKLIERHQSFRTSFQLVKGTPVQRIHDHVQFEIESLEEFAASTIKNFIRPFDLTQAPLLRVGLMELPHTPAALRAHPRRGTYTSQEGREHKYILMVDMHHITADGTSMAVFIKDFMALYEGNRLPGLRIRYKDYSEWQDKEKESETIKQQEKYWLNQFAGEIPALNLPIDYPRPMVQDFEGKTLNFEIQEEDATALNSLALKQEVTLFMLLLSITNILLSKLSGQEEIIIGTPIAARRHADLQTIVGMFVNTLVLPNKPAAEKTFKQFLMEVKKNTLEAYENQEYPFEDLVEKASVPRDASRNPLFDVMFILQNMETIEIEIPGLKLKPYEYEQKTSKFDLTLTAVETGKKLLFKVEYCTKLFKQETILRFISYFKKIVFSIQEDLDIKIAGISIVPEEEKQQILYTFNDTGCEYAADKTLHELSREQAEQTPDHISVIGMEHGAWSMEKHLKGTRGLAPLYITYRELNKRSDQLALHLKEKGVKPDTIVAVMMERRIEIITAILGILKAGGAYLPIDPDYPQERIDFMLKDSGARILLAEDTQKTGKHAFINTPETSVVKPMPQVLYLSEGHHPIFPTSQLPNFPASLPSSLAYVIYTSGSTGNPKGVMIDHQALVNYICWAAQTYIKDEPLNFPLYTSISFDLTVTSIFTPLVTGNAIVVYGQQDKEFLIEKVVQDNRVGIVKLTPSHLKIIKDTQIKVDPRMEIKKLILGGEDLETQLAKQIDEKFNKKVEIYNEYGPTETTVGCMIYKFNPLSDTRSSVPIGVPAGNVKIYLLDKYLHPVPLGVIGEIFISGPGLSRGYLNRAEVTAEKFLPNTFVPGSRMYRSGDLGRWLANENLEFLGRIDQQVKIRGFRIELGEIENQLLRHGEVKEVVVISRDNENKEKYLCAYLVANRDLPIAELREYLSKVLPDYMIPAYFVQIEKIPLTTNGKVDRKALPEPEIKIAEENHELPKNHIQEKLIEIWQQVLGIEKIGINNNFFEIGGDSIKAIRISARLQNYGLKMEIKDLFLNPTIKQLSKYIKKTGRVISQDTVEGEVDLTPIQQWFFENHFPGYHHFNQAIMLTRQQGFDEVFLDKVIKKIVEHHDALRMVYERPEEEVIRQRNRGMDENPKGKLFDLAVFDFKEAKDTDIDKKIQTEANKIQASINLETGPLVKLGLFKTIKGDHLLIAVHHLVIDGVSWRILLEDFNTGYQQLLAGEDTCFQDKTDSFKYWSQRLKEYANSNEILKESAYWKTIEEQEITPLPRDFDISLSPGKKTCKNREIVSLRLNSQETGKLLNEVNQAYTTEINDILLAALGMAVRDWCGIPKILLNLEDPGRKSITRDIDISRTIGWYTTQFPVVLDMNQNQDLSFLIKAVKEMMRHIPYKGIGYGILRYLTPKDKKEGFTFTRDPEISFNYLGQFGREHHSSNNIFQVSNLNMGNTINPAPETKYILHINGMIDQKGELVMEFSYNKYEYKKSTIEKLVDLYQSNLLKIIQHCTQKQEKELTPSDLTYSDFSIEELEDLNDKIRDLIDLEEN
ncbi:MAG: amino acid adenylation domain-containing protein, partial [Candidatus Aminicenantes bacterium]